MASIQELIALKTTDLKDDLICEYADFKGLPAEQARQIIEGSSLKLDPGSATDGFYSHSDDFLINLIRAQNQLAHLTERVNVIAQFIDNKQLDVLDIGGGLGNFCIALSRAGHRCTYSDIPGVIMDFAKKRFQSRGLNIKMVDVRDLPKEKYQVLLNYDVLEHLVDPISTLVEFALHARENGILFLTADFMNFAEPFHLKKNLPYAFVLEYLLKEIGFDLVFDEGMDPVESILKARMRAYVMKRPCNDRNLLLKNARELATNGISQFLSYFKEEFERLVQSES